MAEHLERVRGQAVTWGRATTPPTLARHRRNCDTTEKRSQGKARGECPMQGAAIGNLDMGVTGNDSCERI